MQTAPCQIPYDGLLEGMHHHLEIHDCMGCVLQVEGQPWGLLTLDALDRDNFTDAHLEQLQAFASLASATVGAVMRINRLAALLQSEALVRSHTNARSGTPERELIGHSAAFKQMLKEIDLVGPSELTVLITGETGCRQRVGCASTARLALGQSGPSTHQSELCSVARHARGERIVWPCARGLHQGPSANDRASLNWPMVARSF